MCYPKKNIFNKTHQTDSGLANTLLSIFAWPAAPMKMNWCLWVFGMAHSTHWATRLGARQKSIHIPVRHYTDLKIMFYHQVIWENNYFRTIIYFVSEYYWVKYHFSLAYHLYQRSCMKPINVYVYVCIHVYIYIHTYIHKKQKRNKRRKIIHIYLWSNKILLVLWTGNSDLGSFAWDC